MGRCMNHATRFLVLCALAACGDDNKNTLFSSDIDRDREADKLSDNEKQMFCDTLDTHVSVTVGLGEITRIACAPIALLTSTSRQACEDLLDSCEQDAPKVSLARQERRNECYDSLA